MFEFLRRRARPILQAPLRAIEWDGRTLSLAFDAGALGEVALDIDGCFFASAAVDRDGRAQFAFAYPPASQNRIDIQLRAGRTGAMLAVEPLGLVFGKAGVARAPTAAAARPLAPLRAPARCVPFGVDVAAHDVAIVVPVYNAPELVAACLDAVLAHTSGRARLIVIDDASSDAAIAPLLARYDGRPRVSVLRNATNRGFMRCPRRGRSTTARAHCGRARAWRIPSCRPAMASACTSGAASSTRSACSTKPRLRRATARRTISASAHRSRVCAT
jgi:hypothetical protein